MKDLNRYQGCLLGLATGDAIGTTVEFRPRGSFTPLSGPTGGGPFNLQPGQWTDDTSMALCLATSLTEVNGFDPLDQMRRYLDWYENGTLSSTGVCFDIGGATRQALNRFKASGEAFSGSTDPNIAGNGSLMRLAPVPMFYAPNLALAQHYAQESSRTTHAANECLEACALFARMLVRALDGELKEAVLFSDMGMSLKSAKIRPIALGAYRDKTAGQIRGSGYVVESLEAALWCFWTTASFEQAVLAAANLGDDADTTAAICGQVAGAFYGAQGIPAAWLEKLYMREEISALANRLAGEPG